MEVRALTVGDLDALLDLQEPAAITAFSHIFPQDAHPFPRDDVRRRWLEEIEDAEVHAYVSVADEVVTGFAATRGTELLHFGTALQTWGTGLAQQLHEAVLERFAQTMPSATTHLRLRVFEDNPRARRFYEKLGWQLTDLRTRTTFPPHPVLVEYHLRWGR